MKSSTFKAITVIILILGIIGSIIFGFALKRIVDDFNVTIFISGIIGTVLYCLPLFAIVGILENQETIMWEQNRQAKKSSSSPDNSVTVSNSKMDLSAIASNKDMTSFWTCPKCGERNSRNSRICKGCGREK